MFNYPKAETYKVILKDGVSEAKVSFVYRPSELPRKVRIVEGVPVLMWTNLTGLPNTLPRTLPRKNLRDKKGKLVYINVEVPSCFVTVKAAGRTFKARSCCKPPDVWDKSKARKLALKHAFAQDGSYKEHTNVLCPEDRDLIVRACCPRYFSKEERS